MERVALKSTGLRILDSNVFTPISCGWIHMCWQRTTSETVILVYTTLIYFYPHGGFCSTEMTSAPFSISILNHLYGAGSRNNLHLKKCALHRAASLMAIGPVQNRHLTFSLTRTWWPFFSKTFKCGICPTSQMRRLIPLRWFYLALFLHGKPTCIYHWWWLKCWNLSSTRTQPTVN